jgi:hypothetical protein
VCMLPSNGSKQRLATAFLLLLLLLLGLQQLAEVSTAPNLRLVSRAGGGSRGSADTPRSRQEPAAAEGYQSSGEAATQQRGGSRTQGLQRAAAGGQEPAGHYCPHDT